MILYFFICQTILAILTITYMLIYMYTHTHTHTHIYIHICSYMCFSDSSVGKKSACNAGDTGLIPGLGRSPGEWIGYPLQYSWASLVAQLVKCFYMFIYTYFYRCVYIYIQTHICMYE